MTLCLLCTINMNKLLRKDPERWKQLNQERSFKHKNLKNCLQDFSKKKKNEMQDQSQLLRNTHTKKLSEVQELLVTNRETWKQLSLKHLKQLIRCSTSLGGIKDNRNTFNFIVIHQDRVEHNSSCIMMHRCKAELGNLKIKDICSKPCCPYWWGRLKFSPRKSSSQLVSQGRDLPLIEQV